MSVGIERQFRLQNSYIHHLRNIWTLRIKRAEVSASGKTLVITFTVIEQSFDTKLPFSLDKQNLWKLFELLQAVSRTPVPEKKIKIDVTKLVGLECGATLIDDGVIGFFFPLHKLNTSPQRRVELSPLEVLGFECVDCGSRHFREVLSEEDLF